VVAALVAPALGLVSLLPGAPATTGAPAAAFQPDDPFRLETTWRLPEAPSEPLDLALLADGSLLVADGRRNAVQRYGPDGLLRDTWDAPPTGPLPGYVYVPRCVAADSARGRLFVLWLRYRDTGSALVLSGAFLDTRGLDGSVALPLLALPGARPMDVSDMALDPATGDLWLAGGGRLRRLRVPTGVVDAELDLPPDVARVAVNADGLIALARPAARRVELRAVAGMVGGWDVAPNEPLAVAAGAGGRFHALVRAPSAVDPATPLVLTLDPYGGPLGARAAAAIGAPVPPAGDWPWALDVAGELGALTTGWPLFRVQRYDGAGALGDPLVGGRTRPAYAPRAEDPSLAAPNASLVPLPDGELVVLDERDGHLVRFDPLGRVSHLQGLPERALDVALGGDGSVFVSTADDTLVRLPGLVPGLDPAAADWVTPCDCGLGGRLAAGPGAVYVSRPRMGAVAVVDPESGRTTRALRQEDAVGLWPSDVVADAGGRLFTADLVRAQVQVWDPLTEAGVGWQAGLLTGPRRLAAGRGPDGTDLVAAVMADGHVQVHLAGDGSLVKRFQPLAGDGSTIDAADVAFGPEGRVLLVDARRRAVFSFAPDGGPRPPPSVSPTPSASPGPLSCVVRGDKWAAPAEVVLGHQVGVTLTLTADCPAGARLVGADVVLVIDRSGSMQGGKLVSAKAAARSFAEMLDVRHHRLGLASFSDQASIDVPLTDNVPAVIDGLGRLVAGGGTDMAAALSRAADNLHAFGRPDALSVVILLSDGRNSEHASDPVPVAEAVRAGGTQIYTVGLGDDVDGATLRAVAGRDAAYYHAPTPGQLFPIYGAILQVVLASLAGNLIVDDALGEQMRYVAGSARPQALVSDDRLRWGRAVLPSTGITMSYALLPGAPGCHAANRWAVADYTDADGERRRLELPVPTVCVVTPTPVPSATASPSPTATPVPAAAYLPVLYRRACLPVKTHADVVLLIDVSSSMTADKLHAAKAAARALVALLAFPADQAAVIGFSDRPVAGSSLSPDREAVRRAIDGLAPGAGTRIDRALWAALGELRGPARRSANRPVIVLLSDGGHTGSRADVVDLADEARALGTAVYAVGLGADADGDLLEQIAGHRGRLFMAPDAADLEAIYRHIAGAIPCR